MASHEQFLDDYEISCLVCASDDSEDDRHSDGDLNNWFRRRRRCCRGRFDDDIDLCTMLLTLVTMESRKTEMMSIQK